MVKELETRELQIYLQDLSESEALELQSADAEDGFSEVLIPYMMNDAVEYFFRLQGCRLQGEWNDEIEGRTEVTMISGSERKGILLRQENGNMVSIWYEEAIFEMHNYQYHQIGHEWRSERGQEHYRRLVNLLCVLHDKLTYLGEKACNEIEIDLVPLIEFAPLCYWTPINKSILDWYPESEEGIERMKAFAAEAGDLSYEKKIEIYQKASQRRRRKMLRNMAEELIKASHASIYWLLQEKIEKASGTWERRKYTSAEEKENQKIREEHTAEILSHGFKGDYPFFQKSVEGAEGDAKEDAGKRREKDFRLRKDLADLFHLIKKEKRTVSYLQCVEEHPFTMMESKEYHFRVYEIDCLPKRRKEKM